MPVMLEVTKIFTFDAAHRIAEYVGKCHELHGHTYRVELTVRGPRDRRGIVVDFTDLKAIFKEFYERVLDHRYLNEVIPTANTTAENLAVWFFNYWDRHVRPRYPHLFPERIRIWETPTSYVTLTRADWEAGREDDGRWPEGEARLPEGAGCFPPGTGTGPRPGGG